LVFLDAAWRISNAFGGSVAVLIDADRAIALKQQKEIISSQLIFVSILPIVAVHHLH
jgi:hypothetical protein